MRAQRKKFARLFLLPALAAALLLPCARAAYAADGTEPDGGQSQQIQQTSTATVGAEGATDENFNGAGDSPSNGGTVTIEGMIVDGGADGSSVVQDIPNLTEKVFESDGKNNALQEAIDVALKQVKDTVQATLIISVGNGTYADDITIESNDAIDMLASKIVLVAADTFSIDENSGYARYAEEPGGGVKLNGNVTVDSLDVLLYGLYLSAEKAVKLKDAELEIVGTTENDAVNVEIYGSENERFGLDVKTGAGNDTVKVVQTGARYATNTDPMEIAVDTGAGSDKIDVTLGGHQTVTATLTGGAGNDTITVRAASDSADAVKTVTIRDTEGDNTVTAALQKNRTDLSIVTGDGSDTITASGQKDAKDGVLSIATGAGNDRIALNVSVADALCGAASLTGADSASIRIDAGAGVDTLHLTGALSTKAAERIGGSLQEIGLVNSNEKRLILTLAGTVEHFTDDLENKETVKIEGVDADGYAQMKAADGSLIRIAPKAFITYHYSGSEIVRLRMQQPAQKALFAILTVASAGKLTVGSILAPGLALMMNAKDVTVSGEIYADSILICAEADDSTLKNSKIGGTNLPVEGSAAFPEALQGASLSFFEIRGAASIHILPTAYLHTSSPVGTVTLNTMVSYTHALLDIAQITAGFNFANVKLCSSIIDIAGRLEAYAVHALAKAVVTLAASNSLASLLFVPVAVAVGFVETGVNVRGTPESGKATIQAANEVRLIADSALTMTTTAGTGRLPITFAVSVADNTAYAKISENAVVQSGGDATLSANGTTTVRTTAQKGEKDASNSGGYFAVTVATQDVSAGVYKNASLHAAGKLNIQALAKKNVVTLSTSARPAADDNIQGEMSLEFILDFGKSLLSTLARQLTADALDKLTKAKKQIEGADHALSIEATKNGSAAISAAKANEGDQITVTVSPDKGYKLDKIMIGYRKPGESAQTAITPVKATNTTYTFTMPKGDVKITVTFAADPNGTGGDNGGGTNGTGGNSIKEIVEKASASNSDANRAVTSEPASNTKAKTVAVDEANMQNGAVIVDVAKLAADNTIRVLPNKQIKVTFNPAVNYTIDTLKAVYTSADGKEHEILISPNLGGEYVFHMPDANVTIKATFKQGAAEKKRASTTQLTGALAVTVAQNAGQALVDTTGTVTSGGDASVKAAVNTNVENTADATPNGSEKEDEPEGDPDDEIVAGLAVSDALVVAEMRNGASVKAEGPAGDNKQYTLTFAARLGYELDSVVCTYKNCAGETRSFKLPVLGESTTQFLYQLGMEYDGTEGKTWVKPKYDIAFGEKYAIVTKFKKVGNGETVLTHADEGSGSAAVQIAEGSRFRDGVKAKYNDRIVFTLKGAEGFAPGATDKVFVEFTKSDGSTEKWTVANKKLVLSEDKRTFGFVMPNAVVTIHAAFAEKANPVTVTLTNANELKTDGKPEDPKAEYLVISDGKAVAVGERFTIGLSDAAVLAGLKIDIGTVTVKQIFAGGAEIAVVPEFHLRDKLIIGAISNQEHGDEKFTLAVALKLVNGNCAVTYEKSAGDETGNTVIAPKFADAGDVITLLPRVADNYKLTAGSLAVTVELSTGKTITGAASLGRDGKYTFTIPKPDGTAALQKISIKAAFEQSPGSKTAKSVSVGVGVAVTVVTHTADAGIKNGDLTAKGLTLAADSVANASAVAKAGYSAGDIGVAGSVAVNVASAKTYAAVQAAPTIRLGDGSLEVSASSQGKWNTNADSSGAKMKKGVGVGAAIAVGVFHTDVTALIAANAQFVQSGDPLSGISVSAKQSLTQSMQTKAGASGGTAVTPVLSLLLCETSADALIGASSAAALKAAGNVEIASENIVKRTVTANASAAGANVGVGASFIVTYLKDRSRARLSRSVNTNKNLSVTAKGLITVKSTARAGANGSKSRKTASDDSASEDGGEADKQAQKGVGSLKDLEGKSNNTSETGKQKAETSEGSISVAAAFILNLQTAAVESTIDGGAVILAANGAAVVSSTAQLDTRLNASGSATVAKVGVGVAVALNVVSYSNIAHIGDACILAKELSVTATIPAAKTKADEAEEADPDNYILVFVKGLVKKFLHLLAEDTFLKSMKDTITSDSVVSTITRIILGENNANLKALLSGTGLEKILDANPVDTFLKNWDESFKEIRAILKHEDYEALKELVIAEVKAEVAPLVTKFALSAIGAVKGGFTEDGFTGALKGLCGTIVNKAKKFFGDAKEPAYWADLMSDLFIAASKKLLSGIADLAETKKFITDNFKGKVVENLKSYLSHIGMALTNEVLNRLSAFGNLTIKAQDQVPAHTFYTYAIAGAGAFDVGVAGSAAVAWITGTTLAHLAPVAAADAAKDTVTVTGDMLVRAESVHRMETIASSAVGSNDEPDKNDSEAGDGEDSGTSTSYETKNVALKDGEKTRTLYMTTASADVASKTDDGAGHYTVVYKAKDGFRFTDKSVALTDLAESKVTATRSADNLTLTVKVAYQGTDLKDSFTVKVTGIVCDERTITPPTDVKVTDAVDVEITLSKVKAKKCDRITITIVPKAKDGKQYELNEENLKKALADGKLAMAWTGADGTKNAIKAYETDKKGGLVFFFLMPDEDVKLSITFPAATDHLPIYTELDAKKQATTEEGHGVGVGAAFSMTYTQFDTQTLVGANRRVSAGTFWLDAEGGLEVKTIAVSGTDPIETKNKYYSTQGVPEDSVKKISVDAGVAFGYLGGSVKAVVESGATVTTTSDNTVNINKTKLAKDATKEQKALSEKNANFAVTVREWSATEARASAFTAGSTTAVGACVAVNNIDVASLAAFLGTGDARGAAYVTAESRSKDTARGIATAMGADMARYAQKFRKAGESIEQATNRVTNGEAFNGDSGSSKTETGKKISTKFEKAQGSDGKKSNGSTPVSSQAARSQNAGGDAGEAVQKGNEAASKAGAGNQNGQANASYQVAAAVALNITAHAAAVQVDGALRFGELYVFAANNGNFSTLATGAAMSLSKSSNAVAAAVAVSLNKNTANITVANGTLLTYNQNGKRTGEVRIESQTTQNITEEFSRYMTAQSLAGAISGDGGKVTIAGAASVVKAEAQTQTRIGDRVRITAGNVTIGAADRSRLTARAGSVSFSKGTARGLGASFALIYAGDDILAQIGSDVAVSCTAYTLYAEKASVNASDYSALDWRFLFTNSSNLTDEQRERTQRGVVDVHKNKDTGGYTVDLNFSTDTVLELIELCNYFSAVNYYVEAISGAITSGSNTNLVASGSFALLFAKNSVQALVGDGVTIDAVGDAKITAADDSRVRVIAGAVAAGPAQNAGGLTVGFIKDAGTVRTRLGNGAGTTAVTAATFAMNAANGSDYLVITVAVASAKADALGGAVTVALMQKKAEAIVTDGVLIHAAGSVFKSAQTAIQIAASTDLRLMLISASASLAGKVAAGGTIAAVHNEATTRTVIGERVVLTADFGKIRLAATTAGWMLNILASASAATASGEGTGIAGAVGLLWDKSDTGVAIGGGTKLTAEGDVAIRTAVDSTLMNIFVGAAYGGGNAIGLTLMLNELARTAKNEIGERTAIASRLGNISVDALGTEWTLIVGVGVGVAANKNALAGTNGLTLSKSAAETLLGNHCTLTAGDSISLTANLLIRSYQIVSGIALSGGGTVGVGETITVMTIENTVRTVIGDNAILTANGLGNGLVTGNRSERRRGVYIGATATENLLIVSVSGSAGGKLALSGVAHVLYEKNKVEAKVAAGAELTAENHCAVEPVDAAGKTVTADVKVEADDDSSIIDIAGGLTAANGAGIGATALALVFSKTVTADAGGAAHTRAAGNVAVSAAAKDTLALLALSFGFAKNVSLAGSANALLYENNVSATLGGTVEAGENIAVTAASRETLVNIVVSVSVSTSVGVAAVAVLTFFDSKTAAAVLDRASLTAGGGIAITADSSEYITADVVGGAGGSVGIGGALNLVRSKLLTRANTGANVRLTAGGDVTVHAKDDYLLLSVSGMIGGGTSVGVGVVVTLSFHYNSVDAGVGANNTVSGKNISCYADSKRDFQTFTMTIAGAGTAAVGAAVAVLVAGGNLVQDACNTVLGMETVKNQNYYVYYTKNTSNRETLYRLGDKYYMRGAGDAMTEVAVTTSEDQSGVTYGGKNYMPAAMNPQAQIEGIAAKCKVTLTGASDVNDTIKGDGNTSDKMGGAEYDRYANSDTKSRVDSGSDEPITSGQIDGTNVELNKENSKNGALIDGTSAHIDAGSALTARGDIDVRSHDLLLAIVLAGSVAVGGTAGVGVGFAAAKLMSTVLATVAADATLSADGNITVRAICGAENKEITDTFCPVTNTMGCQKTANDNLPSVRKQLEKTGLIASSGQTGSLWLISIAAAGGGAVGAGVAGGVLLFYSDVKAVFSATVIKARDLFVGAELNYKDVLAVVISLGLGGTVGVGVTVAVAYLEGSVKAEITDAARISAVTGRIAVKTSGESKLRTGAAAIAVGGVAGVSANISVLINKNQMSAGIASGAVISAPQADVLVDAAFKAETNALLITVAGGTVGAAVSVLMCIADMKVRAYVGVSPDAAGAGLGGSITANALSVRAKADEPVKTLIVNIAGGVIGVGAVLTLTYNRIDNVASVAKMAITLAAEATVEALLNGATGTTAATATGGVVAATLVIAVSMIRTRNIAVVDGGAAAIRAASLYVHAKTENSTVSTDIVAGASLGLLTISVYVSVALNKAVNAATVGTGASLAVSGALNILSEGGAAAVATAKTYALLSALNLASIVSIAAITADYSASLLLRGASVSAGSVSVRSLYTAYGDGAKSFAGSAGNAPQISAFNITFLGTFAFSRVRNAAAVTGSGKLTSESFLTEANTNSKAGAYTRQVCGVSIVKVIIIAASAIVCDVTHAYVSGADAANPLMILLSKNAVVQAVSEAVVNAESISPVSVAIVSIDVGSVMARVGRSATDRHTVAAYIGSDVQLTAAAISVQATNKTSATARMMQGFSVAAANVKLSTVPTQQYTEVSASVGARSALVAQKGDVTVQTIDNVAADALVDGKSIGVLVSADSKYAKNTVDQSNSANIGAGACLTAHGGITVQTASNATMLADTNSTQGGLFSRGNLQAHNVLVRMASVSLGDGCALTADFGDIKILAAGGEKDDIQTFARGGGGGLVGIASLESKTTIDAGAIVNVGCGVTITDTFHSVSIQAHIFEHKAISTGDYTIAGLIAAPEIRSFVAEVKLTAKVLFAAPAGKPAKITAKEITVESRMLSLHISALSNAESYMFGGTTRAYSRITIYPTVETVVLGAALRAYDKLYVFASANPDSYGTNLYVRAQGYSGAVISYTLAEAKIEGTSTTSIRLGDGTELTGADVRVETAKFAGSALLNAVAKKAALGWTREYTPNELKHADSKTVSGDTLFHVADAAAGICIDYYYDADGQIQERTVGMPKENNGRKFAVITGTERISLANVRIENLLPGELSVEGVDILACKIYGQAYLQSVTITNHTDAELLVGVIDTYNEAFTRSAVTATSFSQSNQHNSPSDRPDIRIESTGKGNVRLMGKLVNDRGTLTVVWTGSERGSLYTNPALYLESTRIAPIWTHILRIENAMNIGESESKPLEAYLTSLVCKDADGNVIVDADGDPVFESPEIEVRSIGTAFLKLSLTEIVAYNGDTLPDGMDQSTIHGKLDLGRLSAGEMTVLCGTPFRMYYLAKAETAVIVLPGVVEFTTETIVLTLKETGGFDNLMYSVDEIARYFIGQTKVKTSETDTIKLNMYYLPNELVLYLVDGECGRAYGYAPGELYKVTGTNVMFDTSRYRLSYTATGEATVTLRDDGDAVLNLSSGLLTAGSSDIAVYLSYDVTSGKWLIPDGATIVDTTLEELYAVQYTYDANGSRVVTRDANGTPVIARVTDFGKPLFSYGSGDSLVNYYLLYENGPYENVYYLGMNAEMEFVNVFYAAADKAWISKEVGSGHNYNEDWLYVSVESFLGMTGYTLHADFHRPTNSGKRYEFSKHVIDEMGTDETAAIRSIVRNGKTLYFIDDRDSVETADKLHTYWQYTYSGGFWEDEYAYVGASWLAIPALSDLYVAQPQTVTEQNTENGEVHTVTYKAYRYGSLSDPLRYVNFLSYDLKRYHPENYFGDGLQLHFTKDAAFGKIAAGLNYSYDGAYVTLPKGMHMQLYLLPETAEREACYRIFQNRWITQTGKIIGKRAVGTTGNYDIYTYSAPEGLLTIERQIGEDEKNRSLTFLLRKAGQKQQLLIWGDIHLERYCDNVARDIFGRFYYYNGANWEALMKISGTEAIKQGYVLTADGAMVYYAGKLIFRISKNQAGKVLHTIYKKENDSIRYSVDEDGVITWGYEINPAVYQGYYGGSSDGSYLLLAKNGDIDTGRIIVEAGAVLRVDAVTDLPDGATGDATFKGIELKGPDSERAPWPDGHPIPAGKLLLSAQGNVNIGEAIVPEAEFTVDSQKDLTIGRLTGNGGKIGLTAGGVIELDDVDVDGGKLTIGAGDGVTIGSGSLIPKDELSIDAGGGNLVMTDVTLGGSIVTLTADGDIEAGKLKLVSTGGLHATAGGDIDWKQSVTRDCGPLQMEGANILLRDNTGDLKLRGLKAAEDIRLKTDGSVIDVSGNATTPLMTKLRDAQAREDTALRAQMALQKALDGAILAETMASMAVRQAQQKLDETNPNNARAVARAQKRLDEAKRLLQQATETADRMEIAVIGAKIITAQKHLAVEAVKAELQNDIGLDDATLKAGGDLAVSAGGDIGSAGVPILTDASGRTTLAAGGDVHLYAESPLTIGNVTGRNVSLTSAKGIERAENAQVRADDAELTALDGNVGAAGKPILTDGDTGLTASGNNVFLRSSGDLRVGNLTAHGTTADGTLPSGYLWLWAETYFFQKTGTQLVYGRLFLHRLEPVKPDPQKRRKTPSGRWAYWTVLTDAPTTVSVAGYLTADAALTVQTAPLGANDWTALAAGCHACIVLRGAMRLSGRIGGYAIRVSGERAGKLLVSLPTVGVADGNRILVLCCVDGRLTLVACVVVNGFAAFEADGQDISCLMFTDAAELCAYLTEAGEGAIAADAFACA